MSVMNEDGAELSCLSLTLQYLEYGLIVNGVQGLGFGLRVQGLGIRDQGSRFRVEGQG